MEIWNAYQADGQITEQTLVRGQTIPEGLYHLVVECIIRHRDGSILFTRRSRNKASYPHCYEATAGGSALLGEGAEQAIIREIFEETGIIVSADQLQLHTRFVAHDDQCIFRCYWVEIDWDKPNVQLQVGETSEFIWSKPEKLSDFLESEQVIPRQKEYVRSLFL